MKCVLPVFLLVVASFVPGCQAQGNLGTGNLEIWGHITGFAAFVAGRLSAV